MSIEKNLHEGLSAARKGADALRKQAEAMFGSDQLDKPQMWYEGEPMPGWMRQHVEELEEMDQNFPEPPTS